MVKGNMDKGGAVATSPPGVVKAAPKTKAEDYVWPKSSTDLKKELPPCPAPGPWYVWRKRAKSTKGWQIVDPRSMLGEWVLCCADGWWT